MLNIIAFFLGILTGQILPTIPNLIWLIPLISTLIVFIIFPRFRLFFAFLLGLLWVIWRADMILMQKLPTELENKEIQLIGTIIDLPKYNSKSWQFNFKPMPSKKWSNPGNIRLKWYTHSEIELRPGQLWKLTLRLRPVRTTLNPNIFDYSKWLYQIRILTTGSVRTKAKQHLLKPASSFNIDNLRYSLAQSIKTSLNEAKMQGIIIALAIGNKQWISQPQKTVLQHTGTAHLIAISGLHLGLIAWFSYWLALHFWSCMGRMVLWLPAPQFAALFSLFMTFLYALLAGFSISTQRAFIMIMVVIVGQFFFRKIAISRLLATALLLVLLWDPLAVLTAGFWLSFGAVIAIAYVLSNETNFNISPFAKWGINIWKTQWAVTLGLLVMLLSIFGYISLVSPVANLIAIPWVSFIVVPFSLLGSLSLIIFPEFAHYLFGIANYVLDMLWVSLNYLAQLEWSTLTLATPPLWEKIVAFIGIIILLLPRGFPAKWLGIIWLLPLFFTPIAQINRGHIWFSLLDVGQGLATLIQTQHHVLLYDTGTQFYTRSVVIPFLQAQAIKKIDILVISHDDKDHSGGLKDIIQHFAVEKILTSIKNTKYSNTWSCKIGQYWQWDNIDFQVLHPVTNYNADDNNLSCVVKINSQNASILLTGDIEKKAEYYLATHHPEKLKADILVVPHHGSMTSSTYTFINLVQPKIALFSAGYYNRFGHPRKEIVQRYLKHKSKVWNTAQTGMIQFKLSQSGISEPYLARKELSRYWHQ